MATAAADTRSRLDKWLWCTRFYRSRALATEAVLGGRAKLNGERVKPAHAVRPGDLVSVNREGGAMEVEVLALPQRRGPARLAQQAWQETAQSRQQRATAHAAHAMAALSRPQPGRRPDKRERRAMEKLLHPRD